LTSDADGSIKVILTEGQQGIAAGQACVFYADGSDGARVLGGGTIVKTLKSGDQPDLGTCGVAGLGRSMETRRTAR
jgi:tRNA-specific 2-thiouridylase